MTTALNQIRDINGFNTFGLEFSSQNYSATIAVGVAQSLTIPGDSSHWLAVFSFEPGSNVWVAIDDTAEVPAGATLAATTSVLNPTARKVSYGQTLSFITSDALAAVGVSLYAIQQ